MQSLTEFRRSELQTGSIATPWFLYMGVFTLVSLLNIDSASHEPFSKFCELLFPLAQHWPAAAAIFKGLKALINQLGYNFPADSLRYLSNDFDLPQADDVPISWMVPQYSDMLDLMSDDGTDITH